MDDAKVEPLSPTPRRRLWLLALLPVAALAWAGLTARDTSHPPPWQQSLNTFRDDGSADAGIGQSPQMGNMIIVRNTIVRAIERRQPMRLSPAQDHLLITCLKGPVDESSQSEALDALGLAQRAGFLSLRQVQEAEETCLSVLSRMPPPMVRLEGARFLSHKKDSRSIAALRLLLNDPLPKVRASAKSGLTDPGMSPIRAAWRPLHSCMGRKRRLALPRARY